MTRADPRTRTLRSGQAQGAPAPVRLVVIDGPDAPAELSLQAGLCRIGSGPECELRLSDRTVSRCHLTVEHLGAHLRVTDLGSRNGTRYLGARVKSVEVRPGAVLEVGESRVALLPALCGPAQLYPGDRLGTLYGRSVPMRRLFAQVERAAASDAALLVRGETGSGKSLVMQVLHARSPRKEGPLVAFDCAGVQPDLLQAALFGHVRGAFTSARRDAAGALERADGGTLVLEEVAELPLDLQPLLLRALETHAFLPLGAAEPRRSDFRLLASTREDLEARVAQGRFRRDLFHRIAVLTLAVPPLRERLEDLPGLVAALADQQGLAGFVLPPSTRAALRGWRWPGNVRELANAMRRAAALGAGRALEPAQPPDADDFHAARARALRAFERGYLVALMASAGSVSAAARKAGVARTYLYRLLELHRVALPGRGRS